MAYVRSLLGDEMIADKYPHFRKPMHRTDYCFPFRLESLKVLDWAIEARSHR